MNEEARELLTRTKEEMEEIDRTGSDLREQIQSLGAKKIADIQEKTETDINFSEKETINRKGIIDAILNSVNSNDLSTATDLLEKLKK